ncbi:DNA polymerase III subunit delta [Candidatus Synechococcus spongiarum]|uniref:DNA polymerase III subunit delta n=1 Tax=Candidatus Synechococcus spongiarum TaxID=431041 RepID=UPI00094203F6|nr:DNA polymerase III subunit delta [Candidatus Synechococcus spongiarum]
MPVHVYWGDDTTALEHAVTALVQKVLDPAWGSFNLQRLDGQQGDGATLALTTVRMAPFGGGGRLVHVANSPFCERCPPELLAALTTTLPHIPPNCHLLLTSVNKPDGRLKSTKLLQKAATVKPFPRPAVWDSRGQRQMVQRATKAAGVTMEPAAEAALAEAVGSDSGRLAGELEKLDLYSDGKRITTAAVAALVGTTSQTSLQVGEALLHNHVPTALHLLDELLRTNEPALRIQASLVSQVRGWLWVALMTAAGEKDAQTIAKAAGLGNPKRVYVLQRQVQGCRPQRLQQLLTALLELEWALKQGTPPRQAFREHLLPLAQGRQGR